MWLRCQRTPKTLLGCPPAPPFLASNVAVFFYKHIFFSLSLCFGVASSVILDDGFLCVTIFFFFCFSIVFIISLLEYLFLTRWYCVNIESSSCNHNVRREIDISVWGGGRCLWYWRFFFFFFNEPHLDVSFAGLTLVASQRRQKNCGNIDLFWGAEKRNRWNASRPLGIEIYTCK